jgi:hypothetical protein
MAQVPALVLQTPVLAVARDAVLALGLLAPVLAVARAAVLALGLPAPVLAVARAAVLALGLPEVDANRGCIPWYVYFAGSLGPVFRSSAKVRAYLVGNGSSCSWEFAIAPNAGFSCPEL